MAYEFTKYHKLGGAYHWNPSTAGPDYMRHAQNVADWIQEDPVLDIGGGDGYICSRIRATGKHCLVVDNLPYAIELAHSKNQPAVLGDIYNLPQEATERRWGAIYLGDIIEHLDDPKAAIRACESLTDVIYIATPPANSAGTFNSMYHTMEFTPETLEHFMKTMDWIQTKVLIENVRIFARYTKPCK